ncbi:MAG TPA: ABC transporter permease [Anaerolineaceae bacterium]|nr:ABC transporter permease [Anaerolineaceae bacterium]HPN50426.1 ABC transporter permease [Anaerolineaceae bacterium]
MAAVAQAPDMNANVQVKKKNSSAVWRIVRYALIRLLTLFITVVAGVFLTVMIANMGGYVDRIRMGDIQESVAMGLRGNPAYNALSAEERQKRLDAEIAIQAEAQGLNRPFMVRTFEFMQNAMTLNLGRALKMTSDSGSRQVQAIILERLPPTLLLFGSSNLLLFFAELFVALYLSRRYGSWLDKVFVTLAPVSTAPAWFFGIFLILIFAASLRILPFDGMVDAPVPNNLWDYSLSLLRHMVLPVMAVALNSIFLNIYSWRTFFLIYSSEDYVEMAKAKGLTSQDVERNYVLRPTLPTIITSLALMLIGIWTGYPILETVFNWPGLGRAFYQAIQFFDTPVIVGQTVIFAYLLAITVFLLDFVYALVDPRVRVSQ